MKLKFVLAALIIGCGGSMSIHHGPSDAGVVDSGYVEAGMVDAGTQDSGQDAGQDVDAGVKCDGGVTDGGHKHHHDLP